MFRILIPTLYFLATRLRTAKDVVFHAAYEWIPGLALAFIWGGPDAIPDFLLAYVAFLSFYELGYIMNDQLSHQRPGERTRYPKQSAAVLGLAIASRFLVVGFIAYLLNLHSNPVAQTGYIALAMVFLMHNFLVAPSPKCITFLGLSFLRFLLPLAPWLTPPHVMLVAGPVLMNYSFFRLFIYMDSKGLISGLDRKSPGFILGYYTLSQALGFLFSWASGSWLPAGFAAYFLLISFGMTLTLLGRR
jgi:hypothetical protein